MLCACSNLQVAKFTSLIALKVDFIHLNYPIPNVLQSISPAIFIILILELHTVHSFQFPLTIVSTFLCSFIITNRCFKKIDYYNWFHFSVTVIFGILITPRNHSQIIDFRIWSTFNFAQLAHFLILHYLN